MHLSAQQAAVKGELQERLVKELVGVLKRAESLLWFHELCAISKAEGAYSTIRTDSQTWSDLTKAMRDVIAKAEGVT